VLRFRTNWTAAVTDPCATYSYGNCCDFSAQIGGTIDPWLSAEPLSGDLNAGESEIVTVTFNSTSLTFPSINEGSLIFTSNAPGSPHTVPVMLNCGAEGPIMVTDPTSLAEVHDPWEQTTTDILMLTNPGSEPYTYSLAIQRSSTAGPDVVQDPEYVAQQYAQRMADEGRAVRIANAVPGGVSPNMTDDEIIRYDNGVNNDAIGLTSGGTFQVAAYFPAAFMGSYAGMKLSQVEIYINDVPNPCILKVWGPGTSSSPGAPLLEQTIIPTGMAWNLIDLDSEIDITGDDIWIGYSVTHTAGTYPAGCDAGPHVTNGDWIETGGVWDQLHIMAPTLDYNWNIAGYLVPGGPQLTNDVGVQSIVEPSTAPGLGVENVVIKIKNYGTASQSNIPWVVTWSGAGSGQLSGTYAGPLAGGADVEITAGTADLSDYGVYNFEACTNMSGDENTANDCKTKAVENEEPTLCIDNLYSSGCSFGDGLIAWELANINVPDIPCAGTPPWYHDYRDMVHELEAGMTYQLTVTAGYDDTWFDVWIDFDDNLELNNTDELVLNDAVCEAANTPYTFDITIPGGVIDGSYVLRFRTNWLAAVTDPCATYSYGNCCDFTAEIGGDGAWLTAEPMEGTVDPGESLPVTVTYNSQGLPAEILTGALVFTSNALNSPVTVPVTLSPGGGPGGLVITPDTIYTNHWNTDVTDHILTAQNTGSSPITWNVTIETDGTIGFKYSTAKPLVRPASDPASSEKAPGTSFGNEVISTDADYDLQFEFACGDASGEAGIETDGDYIYTTKWNGTGFFKYEINGTFLGAFQVGSVNAIRDLAYDGTYFYGGAAATTVYKMDFGTNTLIGQFTAPVAVRAIAYDEGQDGFWANNWSTTLTLFDVSGAVLNTIPTQGNESFYGLAYDPQGPYLWGYSQRTGSSQNILYKYQLPGGAFIEEFDVFTVLNMPVSGDIAGGLAFHPDLYIAGKYTLLGIVQNVCIWGLEMGDTGNGPWISVDPMSGTIPGNQSADVTVTITSTGFEPGEYYGTVVFNTNNATTPVIDIPVHLHKTGDNVGEITGNTGLSMFPNPAKDVVTIEAADITNVTIVNNLGQVVYDRPADADNVQIQTSNLERGIYIVHIQTVSQTFTEKLIIQ
ncbi:MAG TPA: T9SS type A sorting domain-containing protein, partial [Bacteroidales bacterium]|nr:T9SS type A sorting domain-containing protein [Bacteroidales bacterium]